MSARKTAYRLIMALLLACYGYAAYLALHPDVDPHYRAYYIDRTTTISASEYERLIPYVAGAVVDHEGSPQMLFDGWSEAEESHRWSSGNESQLLFFVEDPGAFSGRIVLDCFFLDRQNITVEINGKAVDSFTGTGENSSKIIPFDPKILKAKNLNNIRFSFPDAKRPGSRDRRLLAMALRQIAIF
ncbi:MAG: hypothetical protein JW793_04285 [Acidobacteria bacterium]|nr:hypothetical protein [Acidobacteriota bacterium]